MVSEPHEMDTNIKFEWKCDTDSTDTVEILVAAASLNSAKTAYLEPTYADYKLIATVSSTKYVDVSGNAPASGLMSYDLSNGVASSGILLDGGNHLLMAPENKYYFKVREVGHYNNAKTASGVMKALPIISSLKFSDFKSRDIISFTVEPKGAKLETLFLLNNLDAASVDYFFNMLADGAIVASVADKLANQIGGSIKVQLEKTQFNLDGALPANPLFTVLAGNSVGLSLGAAVGTHYDLTNNENPSVVAAAQKVWADKADALYAEALVVAASINADPVKYAAGIKNIGSAPNLTSGADAAATAVQTAAALATDALKLANQAAVDGVVVSYTNNQDAQHHHGLTDAALDALKALKVAVSV